MAIWLIFLVCSLNVSGDSIRYSGEFLSGPHTGMNVVHTRAVVIFLKFISSCATSACRDLAKRQF